MSAPVILASSVLCAAGRGTDQVWATVRAGVACTRNSQVIDANHDAFRMGLVPEDALMPASAELDALSLPARARRMLRLAAPTLHVLADEIGEEPCALFLGLPELDPTDTEWLELFSTQLAGHAGISLDATAGKNYPFGRASALMALQGALNAVEENPARPVLIGGVDSFLDLRLLATLDAEGRILGRRSAEGFIPGEGAAFLRLAPAGAPARAGLRPVAVHGAAVSHDAAHRYGNAPALGAGLADAIELLRGGLADDVAPVATSFAGFNGEQFDAKMWGVARLRHRDLFAPSVAVEHPADCFGDTGAAAGAVLVALAATALAKSQRRGPALVWAASDREPRACALIDTALA
jgi:3-oxoacyl-[acyl-carrier-protein] synthase-1